MNVILFFINLLITKVVCCSKNTNKSNWDERYPIYTFSAYLPSAH